MPDTFTLTAPLSTQVSKWVYHLSIMLGETLWCSRIPSGGRTNTPSNFMLQKPGFALLDGTLGSYTDFTFPFRYLISVELKSQISSKVRPLVIKKTERYQKGCYRCVMHWVQHHLVMTVRKENYLLLTHLLIWVELKTSFLANMTI